MIITLCGSARFERLYHAWNEALTISGHTVFALTAYPSMKNGEREWYTPEVKAALDAAHFRKIDASDAILVLNLHGYIGFSTHREIRHAYSHGKRIYALESWGKGCGIGPSHKERFRRQAEADGCLGFLSPISTVSPRMGYSHDLLCGPGAVRSGLVVMLEAARWTISEEVA